MKATGGGLDSTQPSSDLRTIPFPLAAGGSVSDSNVRCSLVVGAQPAKVLGSEGTAAKLDPQNSLCKEILDSL